MTGRGRRVWLMAPIGCWLPLAMVVLLVSGCSKPPAADQQPGDQPPGAEQPAGQPGTEQPGTEQPTPETPAPEQPGAETPSPEPPSIEQPAPEQPSPEQPAGERPAPEQPAAGAGDPNAPVSSYAAAEGLASQLKEYLEDLEDDLAEEAEFADSQAKVAQDASALAVIALALGLHDQDNPYRDKAASIVEAARQLAEAGDYAAAGQALSAVKEAVAEGGDGDGELKWEPIVPLEHLMKEVPQVNTNLKRYTRGEQWRGFCLQMRDAAAAVGAGVKAQDLDATQAALQRLAQSCDDCHAVFKPEDH